MPLFGLSAIFLTETLLHLDRCVSYWGRKCSKRVPSRVTPSRSPSAWFHSLPYSVPLPAQPTLSAAAPGPVNPSFIFFVRRPAPPRAVVGCDVLGRVVLPLTRKSDRLHLPPCRLTVSISIVVHVGALNADLSCPHPAPKTSLCCCCGARCGPIPGRLTGRLPRMLGSIF